MAKPQDLLEFAPEVAAARAAGRAIVALESTIISHGMPYPQNAQTAREVEAIIRAQGAVPATIAVLDGKIRIGLTDAELELLGRSPEALKVSRRDLPFVVASHKIGATTVAATMICAALADIAVMVTGGIGGVHRGAETSFDISADLQELARTSVAVVCAGAKAVLDLRLTLEYLETHGVPVVGYGTDHLPAFWSRDSGFGVDARADTPADVARIMHAKWSLGLVGGLVIANPIPDRFELPRQRIEHAIEAAVRDAQAQGIAGKAVTPFLLGRVNALTGGDSLEANVALVRNNAMVAAKIAAAYAALS